MEKQNDLGYYELCLIQDLFVDSCSTRANIRGDKSGLAFSTKKEIKIRMRKNLYLAGVCFVGFFIPFTLNAQTFITLTVGGLFANSGQNQTITFDPFYWKTFTSNSDWASQIYFGLSIGGRVPLTRLWELEVGTGYYQTGNLNQNGKIYQYSSPNFQNLNYHYAIQNQRFMVEGKLLNTYNDIYHPYLSVGIGASRNFSYNYQEIPVQDYAISDPFFSGFTQTNFSYSVGIGLNVDVAKKWSIGGGYEYSNLGTAKLGRSPVQTTSQQLNSKTIKASQILLQVNYTI